MHRKILEALPASSPCLLFLVIVSHLVVVAVVFAVFFSEESLCRLSRVNRGLGARV